MLVIPSRRSLTVIEPAHRNEPSEPRQRRTGRFAHRFLYLGEWIRRVGSDSRRCHRRRVARRRGDCLLDAARRTVASDSRGARRPTTISRLASRTGARRTWFDRAIATFGAAATGAPANFGGRQVVAKGGAGIAAPLIGIQAGSATFPA